MSSGPNLWAAARRQAFELVGPTGIYVVVPDMLTEVTTRKVDGTVHGRFGHNRPSWPIKIGTTRQRRDTISALHSNNPWVGFKVRILLWLPNHAEALKLEACVKELLARAAETAGYQTMRAKYIEAGPNFAIVNFERYVFEIAKRLGVIIWSEKTLNQFLDRAIELAGKKGIQIINHRGHRVMSMAPAFKNLCDRLLLVEHQHLTQPGKRKYT